MGSVAALLVTSLGRPMTRPLTARSIGFWGGRTRPGVLTQIVNNSRGLQKGTERKNSGSLAKGKRD